MTDSNEPSLVEEGDRFDHVRRFASKQRERLRFDSRNLPIAQNEYVAWIDLMGAGHVMSVSVAKSANYLARLHMVVDVAVENAPGDVVTNPINDGVFITSPSKSAIMSVVRETMYTLGSYFISTKRPHDRCLVRGAIAFGPTYHGAALEAGLSGVKRAAHAATLSRVQFGPPIIQAYQAESRAPPYGVAVHESARAFAPSGETPFRQTHWLWWPTLDELPNPRGTVGLPDLARCLAGDLTDHFDWMKRTAIFHGVGKEKIGEWEQAVLQYFSVG